MLQILHKGSSIIWMNRRYLQIDILHLVGNVRAIRDANRRMMPVANVAVCVVISELRVNAASPWELALVPQTDNRHATFRQNP